MNNDLRTAISHICKQLSEGADVDPAEVSHISAELKKITGHALSEADHLLYMKFHYELAKRETFTVIHRLPCANVRTMSGGWFDTVEQELRAGKTHLLNKFGLFATETHNGDEPAQPHLLTVEDSPGYNK